MTSCTKDYTCTCTDLLGQETVVEYEGLNNEEAEAGETACNSSDEALKLFSGRWLYLGVISIKSIKAKPRLFGAFFCSKL